MSITLQLVAAIIAGCLIGAVLFVFLPSDRPLTGVDADNFTAKADAEDGFAGRRFPPGYQPTFEEATDKNSEYNIWMRHLRNQKRDTTQETEPSERDELRQEALAAVRKLLGAPCRDDVRKPYLKTMNKYLETRNKSHRYGSSDPRFWKANRIDDDIIKNLSLVFERRYFKDGSHHHLGRFLVGLYHQQHGTSDKFVLPADDPISQKKFPKNLYCG